MSEHHYRIDMVSRSKIREDWLLTDWSPTDEVIRTRDGKMPYLAWCKQELNRFLPRYPDIRLAVSENEECCLYSKGGMK